MTVLDSRSEYESRMHRVLEHIDRNLGQPLDLTTLATVACFSPYHFHRLFSAWMGETLGDYLRRRRLEVAATRLVAQPRVPILPLALAVGFQSPEAFARAFRARFGSSPTAWRRQQREARSRNSNPGQVDRKPGQAQDPPPPHPGVSNNPFKETPMKVQLTDRQPTTVAYLRHVGPYGEPVTRFWRETVAPWMATNGLMERPRYGISHDDPTITAPEQCRYDACVEVPASFVGFGGAHQTTIPGGRYAVHHFEGTLAQIAPTWKALLSEWLPSSGLQLDSRPFFEHYPQGSSWDPKTGRIDFDICIPVAPL